MTGRCDLKGSDIRYYDIDYTLFDWIEFRNNDDAFQLTLPMHPSFPGSELTKDPFRWDQRIFSIVLRFKGNCDNDFVDSVPFDTQINAMCEVTGGETCNYLSVWISAN